MGVAGCCEGDLEMFLSQSSPNIKRYVCFFGDGLWQVVCCVISVCVVVSGWIKGKKWFVKAVQSTCD